MVEHLPNIHKVLGSILGTIRRKSGVEEGQCVLGCCMGEGSNI